MCVKYVFEAYRMSNRYVIISDVQYTYIIYRDNRYNLPYRDYDMSFSYIDISSHSNLTSL